MSGDSTSSACPSVLIIGATGRTGKLVVQRCLQLGYQVTAVQHSEKNPFRVQDVPLVPTTTNTRHPRPTSAAREAPAGPAGQEQVHVASFSEPPTPPLPISPTLSPGSIARRMLSSMLSSSASSPSSSASLADEITNDDTVLYTWRASRLRELPSGPLSPSLRHEAELGALAGRLAAQAGEVSAPFVESEGSSPASVLSPAERILAPETPRLTERKEAVSSLPSAPPTSAASGGPASTYTHLRVVTGDLWDVNELQRLLRETHHDAVLFCARSELGGGRKRGSPSNIVPVLTAMRGSGVDRLVVISCCRSHQRMSWFARLLRRLRHYKRNKALNCMEETLTSSAADIAWTVVEPFRLSRTPLAGQYIVCGAAEPLPPNDFRTGRWDLADFLAWQATSRDHVHETVHIVTRTCPKLGVWAKVRRAIREAKEEAAKAQAVPAAL